MRRKRPSLLTAQAVRFNLFVECSRWVLARQAQGGVVYAAHFFLCGRNASRLGCSGGARRRALMGGQHAVDHARDTLRFKSRLAVRAGGERLDLPVCSNRASVASFERLRAVYYSTLR